MSINILFQRHLATIAATKFDFSLDFVLLFYIFSSSNFMLVALTVSIATFMCLAKITLIKNLVMLQSKKKIKKATDTKFA